MTVTPNHYSCGLAVEWLPQLSSAPDAHRTKKQPLDEGADLNV